MSSCELEPGEEGDVEVAANKHAIGLAAEERSLGMKHGTHLHPNPAQLRLDERNSEYSGPHPGSRDEPQREPFPAQT